MESRAQAGDESCPRISVRLASPCLPLKFNSGINLNSSEMAQCGPSTGTTVGVAPRRYAKVRLVVVLWQAHAWSCLCSIQPYASATACLLHCCQRSLARGRPLWAQFLQTPTFPNLTALVWIRLCNFGLDDSLSNKPVSWPKSEIYTLPRPHRIHHRAVSKQRSNSGQPG